MLQLRRLRRPCRTRILQPALHRMYHKRRRQTKTRKAPDTAKTSLPTVPLSQHGPAAKLAATPPPTTTTIPTLPPPKRSSTPPSKTSSAKSPPITDSTTTSSPPSAKPKSSSRSSQTAPSPPKKSPRSQPKPRPSAAESRASSRGATHKTCACCWIRATLVLSGRSGLRVTSSKGRRFYCRRRSCCVRSWRRGGLFERGLRGGRRR